LCNDVTLGSYCTGSQPIQPFSCSFETLLI
jgi:hypothetical protein